jgi:N-acetylmuramoyl-L-alanine amidase
MRHLLTIPALLLTGAVLQAGSVQVTGIRAWSFPGITRVAIEVNGPFTYASDRAHAPERIFFDLDGTVPGVEGKRAFSKDINDKLIKRVRVGLTKPGVTRVVLDLEGASDFTVSQLSNPDRLMVELHEAVAKPGEAGTPGGAITAMPPVSERPAAPPAFVAPAAVASAVVAPLRTASKAAVAPPEEPETKPAAKLPAATGPDLAKMAKLDPHERMAVLPKTSPELTARAAQMKQELPTPPVVSPSAHTASHVELVQSLTRTLGLKVNRIVIDAGHGGHDTGTVGPDGVVEKDLVLDVAQRLGKLVEQRMGAEVIFTRNDDTFVPLEERTAIANRSHADLFLSIHANSSPAPEVAGIETYYLNFTNSPEAMTVAARENAASDKSVFQLKDLIQKISLHDKLEESKQFADSMQASMQALNVKSFPTAHNRGVRKAPFVVLIGASMPSVLTEIGFLTNTKQEKLLARPEYRQKVAEALYSGLHGYTQSLSHFEVATSKPQAMRPETSVGAIGTR